MTGTIKRLRNDKGFGFITDEVGTEYFFHRSEVSDPKGFDKLREGQKVEFTVANGPKGLRAEGVYSI